MRFLLSVIVVSVIIISGCATKVTRTETDKVFDLSGLWNDTDARLVAQEMIDDCLKGRWINDFNVANGKMPTVIVGTVKNRTTEHLSSRIFIEDLERALINSGKVEFVADKEARQEIREERDDQQAGNTNPETMSPRGLETGADYMLQGSVNSVKDSVKGKFAIFYQVTLELIDLKTNRKVWIGQKEVKKLVERPRVSP